MVATAPSQQAGSPPLPRTRLIGREAERVVARKFLLEDAVPLLTLTGPGGVGKTRLAVAVAQDVADHFADGVVWIDLAPVTDPSLVPATVAAALALPESAGLSIVETVTRALQSRQMLLLLDNCEHVVAMTADLVATLLSHCHALQVLATSRVLLGLSYEQNYPVPPLVLPTSPPSGTGVDLPAVAGSSAVQLFVVRAQAVQPEFTLNASNATPVAAICQRLDGLPLALELAAARIRHLPPHQLLEHLAPRMPLLAGGPRDHPRRLQTMRDAIAWSYGLLSQEEQAFFRGLAVFVGGFTLEAAETVLVARNAGRGDAGDVLAGIGRLLDQSLLYRGEAEKPRFGMLETIREFASEALEASGDETALRDAHAAYYLDLAERADPELPTAPQRLQTALRLDPDLDNVRAALTWLAAHGQWQVVQCLAASASWTWNLHGRYQEGIAWLQQALAMSDEAAPAVRIHALQRLSAMTANIGQFSLAEALAEETLALARAHDDQLGMGRALLNLGILAERQGDRVRNGQLQQAALAAFRASGNPYGLAHILSNLGDWAYSERDYAQAESWSAEALAIGRALHHPWYIVGGLACLAQVVLERGSAAEATSLYLEMATLSLSINDEIGVAGTLSGLAGVALLRHHPESATRWLASALASRERLGSVTIANDEQFSRSQAAARAMLSGSRFAAIWEEGWRMALRPALAEAVEMVTTWQAEDKRPSATSPAAALGLSPRECDVLRLLVAGRSDPEIARVLCIGRRTAQSHVSSILKKLQVSNRTEAASVAARDRLI